MKTAVIRKPMAVRTRTDPPLVTHQSAFLTIAGFWIFYTLIFSLRSAIMEHPMQTSLAPRRMAVACVGMALTFLLHLILQKFDRKTLGQRVAISFTTALPFAITIALANYYVFNVYDPINMFDTADTNKIAEIEDIIGFTTVQIVAEFAVNMYFFLVAWCSIYLVIGNASKVRSAERKAARFAQAAQDAELRSLRYQVNPHFLFNTLNSLSSLVITGKSEQAEAMIQNMSIFYRNSLSSDPLEDVTLLDEVESQKLYLEIEAVRYPKRLKVEFAIDPALENMLVPAMILQPLVENVIKYGVSYSSRPVTLRLSAWRTGDYNIIQIEDDGEQIASDQKRHGSGIGLPNVRDRLEARYGGRAKLETFAKPSGGFVATITLPIEGTPI
jgi:two-component system, LytTR family, sensor kinase